MSRLRLYSARICPFAHRVRLAIDEKAIDCEIVEVNLESRPDWFMKLSPTGRVPLLERSGELIWESIVINEYLEEVYPDPPLLPAGPADRAWVRIWIEYGESHLLPSFYGLLTAREVSEQRRWADQLGEALSHMEQKGLSRRAPGPYWLGEKVSLIDVALYPFFERFAVLAHYRGFSLRPDWPGLVRWQEAMEQRASVRAQAGDLAYYIAGYAGYALGNTGRGGKAGRD